jgi:hypothetical protein
MSSRAAKFASAVFATVLTGAPVTAVLQVAADAAEGCRTEPGDQTPQGKHWRYRIEHPSNRQCWYLRDEGGRAAQAGVTNPQQSEKAAEQQTESPAPRSLADAHAEFPWPQPRTEPNTAASVPQQPQTMPVDAANVQNGQRPNVLESTTRGSLIGSRWPDPSAANSTGSPQPAASDAVVADAQIDQPATPTPAAPPAALAAADVPPAKAPTLQTLLMVIAGALALAGLTGSAIYRLGGARRRAPNTVGARRRVAWDTPDGARQSPAHPSPPRSSPPKMPPWTDPEQFARRPDLAPGFHEDSDPNQRLDRISEFLERMSKQAAN